MADRLHDLQFHADGSKLLISSSGSRREVNLLRAEDGSQIAQFDSDAHSQAMSADGKWIAIGSTYGDLILLDGATGALLGRSQPYSGSIYALAFTPDNYLLTSGDEGKFHEGRWIFRLLDPQKLTTVGTFFGLRPGAETDRKSVV